MFNDSLKLQTHVAQVLVISYPYKVENCSQFIQLKTKIWTLSSMKIHLLQMISHQERFHLGLIVLHSLSALTWNTFSPCDFQCFSIKWILREFDADRICWNRNWNSGEIHNIVMMTTVCYCFASCFEHATWLAVIVIHIKIFVDPVWCIFAFIHNWWRNEQKKPLNALSSLIIARKKQKHFLSR